MSDPADTTPPPAVPPTRDNDQEAAIDRVRTLIDALPDQIGRYRILERLGHGGMGDVYVAEQTEPIKRRVALKVIKAGMDTRQVVARFEAERQALAMMDHPNIARVFDAGTTDSGRPYFVMELVRGVPITQFCDDARLSTRQRIELLVPVCQAVQHAHQKGIIHRDIKPNNVLVTLHDGKPVPKVIDFGIAKATGPSLTDKTVYTEFRQMIGTPAYMSPEQAEMSGLDIDTRSDIYSLGVLTYELLTGTTPFDTARLVQAGLAEIQRIIKQEDPPRPSLRISTLGDRLPTMATQRGSEASRIGKLVAGELDWIVMRAMEKDRRRRYETANDLAADFNRHLAGEPIEAAPPSAVYRTKKFARKHRTSLAITSILLTVSSIGTVATTTQWFRAKRAEQVAVSQRDELENQTQKVNESLRDLVIGAFAPERGGTGFSGFGGNQSNPAWTMLFRHEIDGSKKFRLLPIQLRASEIEDALARPQPPIKPGTLLDALSVAVSDATYDLRRQKSAAETEAYIANVALAQAAMAADRWPEVRHRLDACPVSKRGWEWNFLHRTANVFRFAITANECREAAVSPDGMWIAGIGSPHRVFVWEAATGRKVAEFSTLPNDPVRSTHFLGSVVFRPDSKAVLVANESKAVQFDLGGKQIGGVVNHGAELRRIGFSTDGQSFFTVSEAKQTRKTWNDDGHLLGESSEPARPTLDRFRVWQTNANGLSVSLDRNTSRGGIVLHDPSGRCVGTIGDRTFDLSYAQFIPPGNQLLATARGNDWTSLYVIDANQTDGSWDRYDEDEERDLEVRLAMSAPATTQPIHAAEKIELDLSDPKLIRVLRQGRQATTLPSQSSAVSSTRYASCDGRLVIADDVNLRFFDTQTWREMAIFQMNAAVTQVRFTPDGQRLVIDLANDTSEIWDTRIYAERQKDRDVRFNEIPAAGEYARRILSTTTSNTDLNEAVRQDIQLSSLQKLATLDVLRSEINRINRDASEKFNDLKNNSLTVEEVRNFSEAHQHDNRVAAAVNQVALKWKGENDNTFTKVSQARMIEGLLARDSNPDLVARINKLFAAGRMPSHLYWRAVAMGIYEYRQRHYQTCIDGLATMINRPPDEIAENDGRAMYLIYAMALEKLGRHADALKALNEARKIGHDSNFAPYIIDEATALINPATTQPATTQSAKSFEPAAITP